MTSEEMEIEINKLRDKICRLESMPTARLELLRQDAHERLRDAYSAKRSAEHQVMRAIEDAKSLGIPHDDDESVMFRPYVGLVA